MPEVAVLAAADLDVLLTDLPIRQRHAFPVPGAAAPAALRAARRGILPIVALVRV